MSHSLTRGVEPLFRRFGYSLIHLPSLVLEKTLLKGGNHLSTKLQKISFDNVCHNFWMIC
jgi:hypothetical protein